MRFGLACLLLLGAGLFRVWVYHGIARYAYELSRVEAVHESLTQRYEELRLEWSSRASPKALTELAQTHSLRPADPQERHRVEWAEQ